MATDRTGGDWKGTDPAELQEFLAAYSADEYPIGDYRPSTCACGAIVFTVAADDDEGVARRTCVDCGRGHFICESEEYWADADHQEIGCPCGAITFNVGVGYSFVDERDGIKWVWVGVRCVRCGTLGCAANWKIDYLPSEQLLDLA